MTSTELTHDKGTICGQVVVLENHLILLNGGRIEQITTFSLTCSLMMQIKKTDRSEFTDR